MRWLLWSCLGLLACRELPEGPTRLYEESFEDVCVDESTGAETPCGWSQIAGPEGGASWVDTIHPGEHGIRLAGEGTIVRGPAGMERTSVLRFGAVELYVSARCDVGTQLIVEAGLRDVETGASDTFRGRATPSDEWGNGTIVALVSDFALVDGGVSGGMFGSANVRIDILSLRVSGGGACEVDHMIIDDVGLAVGPNPDADEGC